MFLQISGKSAISLACRNGIQLRKAGSVKHFLNLTLAFLKNILSVLDAARFIFRYLMLLTNVREGLSVNAYWVRIEVYSSEFPAIYN